MATWRIIGILSASKYLGIVEADTKEEAIEKAEEELVDEMHASLCHYCSREIDLGETYDLEAEKED